MEKRQEGTGLLIRFMFIFALAANFLDTARALSDKRLCADENCKEIISLGTGKINYPAGEEGMVSFKMNSNIRIKSKSAGKDMSLWGIEVNGREGYAPKRLILEKKILIKESDLKYEVDVQTGQAVQALATSESTLEDVNSAETKTTTPLSGESLQSTESPLKNSTNASPPIATPVPSQVMNSTKMSPHVNDGNGNTKTDSDKDDNMNNLETQPVTGHNGDHPNNAKHEDFQEQSEEEDPNISNFTKDSVDIVNNKTEKENREEGPESANQVDTNSESSEEMTQGYYNSEESEVDAKTKEESTNNEESSSKETENEHFMNVDAVNKNDSIGGEQFQNQDKNIEMHPENSQQKSNVDMQNLNDTKHLNINASYNSTNESTDATEFNSTTPANGISLKENTENSTLTQKPVIDSESSKEKETNQKPLNEDTEHGVQNRNPASEPETTLGIVQQNSLENKEKTTQEFNRSYTTEANDINQKNEITKPSDYNSTDGTTEVVADEKHSFNDNNLNNTGTETNANINSDNKESNSTYNTLSQQEDTQTVNNDGRADTFKIDNNAKTDSANGSASKANEEYIALHSTNISNVDDKYGASGENPPQTEYNSKTVSETSGEKFSENDKAENNVDEHTTNNKEDIEADEEINTTSSDDINPKHFDNNQDAQPKQTYEETTDSPEVSVTNTKSGEEQKSSKDNTKEGNVNTTPQMTEQIPSQKQIVWENINPTTYKPHDDIPLTTPLPTEADYSYGEQATNTPPNAFYDQQTDNIQNDFDSSEKSTTETYNSIPPTVTTASLSPPLETKNDPKKLTSSTPLDDVDVKENKGLFATIMGTVNNMLPTHKKNRQSLHGDSELDSILFAKKSNNAQKHEKLNEENSILYCKNIEPGGDCPQTERNHDSAASHFHHTFSNSILDTDLSWDTFLKSLASKILELSQLLAFLAIAAAAILFFLFGYYCFCNSSREGALLSKLNQLESSLLATHKENAILKHNLMATRQKLASIEDNSFGSNDMVVSLKKELEEELIEKSRLQEQITVLQKELENAADAGIELNKIVSELLSNQTGDESIISSVEELQKQLNEQQNTIFEINASLAEKSRENSELQLLIAEQNARYETELATVQRDNDELEHEKGALLTKLDEMKNDFDKDITAALEGKNMEIKRLQNDIVDLTNKLENEHTKWQTSVAKIEALEECLKNVRRDPNVNITEVIDVAYVKAQLIEIQKKYTSLKERHETELDARKLAESQLEVVCTEVEKLKQEFNQSEKDKLEAQTRLEVLSNYFKDKENQLQKELNLKEAMWLKQQGETTTTVDRLTAMQEEIQSLKSQNDSLRAEIEAQVAAYKAKTGTLENRAHETWLAARQSDRRYEEARAEATALRRKLTALAGGNVSEINKSSTAVATLGDELTQAPSPIHMESPGSPMLGRMPPPPFLPPPFMGHPPPFMGMPPPPPFVPPGEMRPAPLGRIMSPPPQRSGRFSPQHLDYDDYLDYDTNDTWHRHTYSPPPRTYRSLSPTDSRYNYGTERDLMSTYDTETDFSPPPSPRESRRRVGTSSERIDTKISYGNTKKFNSSNKGPLSSGSEKSFNTPSHNETKTKKGHSSGGGKSLV